MRVIRIALPALTLATALVPAVGHADPYRWCAQYSDREGSGGKNCGFVTLRQCQETLSGMGGICEPNPFYTGPERETMGRGRSHRLRDDRSER